LDKSDLELIEPTPEGSHVSSKLGRKAQNSSMDIYYRKANNSSMDIYYRKANNSSMDILLSQGANGHRHVTPPGSGNKNEPTPEGSHVSSKLGRKAQNSSMDIYYRKAHKWYNENIYYRKAQMA
jgi:hypothetical protein